MIDANIQFDTSATAVIMTDAKKKSRYELLINDQQEIESRLVGWWVDFMQRQSINNSSNFQSARKPR